MEPSHYAGTDAIAKQEAMAARLVEMGVPADRAFCAATALKYVERCGRKEGASIAEDMEKAANYLFRAMGGRWPWEDAVLAADGLPLRGGERVYHVETGAELVVEELPKPGAYQAVVVFAPPAGHPMSFDPDRLTHERPVLDADGNRIEPAMDVWWVCEGDERGVHAEKLHVESIGDDGLVTCDPFSGGTWVELESSELYVHKPVLDADGVPIHEGDTVWLTDGRGPWKVSRIVCADRLRVICDDEENGHLNVYPDQLTHTKPEPPDSWERLEEDAGKNPFDYCKDVGHRLDTCENSEKYKARDLVRRARALAERDAE